MLYRSKKLSVEMCDIVEKMGYQSPESFTWFYIFLSAFMAVSPVKAGLAVKANFFRSFFTVRQRVKILAKNKESPCFALFQYILIIIICEEIGNLNEISIDEENIPVTGFSNHWRCCPRTILLPRYFAYQSEHAADQPI